MATMRASPRTVAPAGERAPACPGVEGAGWSVDCRWAPAADRRGALRGSTTASSFRLALGQRQYFERARACRSSRDAARRAPIRRIVRPSASSTSSSHATCSARRSSIGERFRMDAIDAPSGSKSSGVVGTCAGRSRRRSAARRSIGRIEQRAQDRMAMVVKTHCRGLMRGGRRRGDRRRRCPIGAPTTFVR